MATNNQKKKTGHDIPDYEKDNQNTILWSLLLSSREHIQLIYNLESSASATNMETHS